MYKGLLATLLLPLVLFAQDPPQPPTNLRLMNGVDLTAPSVPQGMAFSGSTETTVSLVWTAATDNVGVAGYHLYRDNLRVGSTTQFSYTFANLTCGTTYTFALEAYDSAGNVSNRAAATGVTSTAACSGGGTPTSPPPPPPDSPTGTVANIWIDTNGGTCARSSTAVAYADGSACGSFDAANDIAQSGDLVLVRGGTYGPQTITGGANRTAQAYIRVLSGEVMTVAGALNFSGAHQIAVDGGGSKRGVGARLVTTTMGSANPKVPNNQYPANVHGGSRNVTLQGADFGGWMIIDSQFVTYRNNDIGPCDSYDRQDPDGGNLAYCDNGSIEYCETAEIGCAGYNSHHLVEYNNIHDFGCSSSFFNGQGSDDCHWECTYVSYADNLTIRGNVFTNCANGGNIFNTFSNGGGSFTADFGFRNYTIENNVFERSCSNSSAPCGGRLDTATGFGHCNIYSGPDFTNVTIRNNTFLDGSGFDMDNACTQGSPGVTFTGNIRNGGSAACASTWTVKPTFQHEIYYRYGATCGGTGNINLGVGSTLAGIVVNSTSGASKDGHLTTGVSIVDNRVLNGCAAADADGVLRPTDGRLCEAGAYERAASTSSPPPPPDLFAWLLRLPTALAGSARGTAVALSQIATGARLRALGL
ncbi:MAG TPA: fibronectin type III domain-containing protein [Vicinamibacterales bacterium]|nr:fibronectin type III domain-containing protein [Vicinamibacterales bacterium]